MFTRLDERMLRPPIKDAIWRGLRSQGGVHCITQEAMFDVQRQAIRVASYVASPHEETAFAASLAESVLATAARLVRKRSYDCVGMQDLNVAYAHYGMIRLEDDSARPTH